MKKVKLFSKILYDTEGSTSVIFVCTVLLVIILSALITDIGYIAFERYRLSRDVDSILMKGAQALVESREKCVDLIKKDVAEKINGVSKMDIRISEDNREISLHIKKDMEYIFLRYLGFKNRQIESRVTAKLSNVTSFKGIRPFAVGREAFAFGKQYYLTSSGSMSEDISNAIPGKLVPLDVGKEGFGTALIYGYRGKVNIGSRVYSAPVSSLDIEQSSFTNLIDKCRHDPPCTYEKYVEGCPKIMIFPVVERIEAEDSSKAMRVVGFTTFFIEDGYADEINEGSIALKGRFIKYKVNALTSDGMPDFGLLGVKLVH